MENQESISTLETELRRIKIADFKGITGLALLEWVQPREEMPEDFWAKFKDLPKEMNLFDVLMHINKELFPPDGVGDNGKSFADSRFTSLPEMLERHMVSCGAKAKIFSEVLRRFSIPVQLVHLNPDRRDHPSHRHTFIRIYDPASGGWITLDPTNPQKQFMPYESAYRELKTYHSWAELKPDFERGEY